MLRQFTSYVVLGGVLLLAGCTQKIFAPGDSSTAAGLEFQVLRCLVADCTASATVQTKPQVLLYSVGTQPSADFATIGGGANGRAGGNSICSLNKGSQPAPIDTCPTVYAFISVTGDDLESLPTNKGFSSSIPVTGPTGVQISATWSAMFDGAIDVTLATAAVLPAAQGYWSFSDAAGNPASTCLNGTDGTGGQTGTRGDSSGTGLAWIVNGGPAACNNNASYLLCVCVIR